MNKKLSYTQLIQQLKSSCISKRSGTATIISSDSHSIRFILKNGVIIACAYTMTQGNDAFPLIQKIQGGTFSFLDGISSGGVDMNQSPLPDTKTIFKILEVDSTITNSQATTAIDTTAIIESIEKELSLYVGPMAEFICEEFFEDMGMPSNKPRLEAFVNSIASEIDDINDRELFKQAVMKTGF